MKKLLLALLCAPAVSFAAGPLDGIYLCNVSGASAYITINGQPDGRSIFAVAAINPSQTFYGYGQGTVVNGSFTGTTSFGQPFSLGSSAAGLNGSINIVSGAGVQTAFLNCTRIW